MWPVEFLKFDMQYFYKRRHQLFYQWIIRYKILNFNLIFLSRFLGSDNHETYFSATQRHQVAYEILATQVYGKRKKAEIGIDRMIEEEIYSAAYPLHEVNFHGCL